MAPYCRLCTRRPSLSVQLGARSLARPVATILLGWHVSDGQPHDSKLTRKVAVDLTRGRCLWSVRPEYRPVAPYCRLYTRRPSLSVQLGAHSLARPVATILLGWRVSDGQPHDSKLTWKFAVDLTRGRCLWSVRPQYRPVAPYCRLCTRTPSLSVQQGAHSLA